MIKNFDGEEWRPIAGFEHAYEVSSMGRVRSLPRQQERKMGEHTKLVSYRTHVVILKPKKNNHGYLEVCLRNQKRQRMAYIQRLVCEAFHGPAPDGRSQAAHLNGLKADNRTENLMWASPAENIAQTKYENHAGRKQKLPYLIHPEKRRAARLLLSNGFSAGSVKRCLGLSTKSVDVVIRALKGSDVASPSPLANV